MGHAVKNLPHASKISGLLRTQSQQQYNATCYVARATELLAGNLKGITTAEVDAAIVRAVDLYRNGGQPATQAIIMGIQYARELILHRQALMLCAS